MTAILALTLALSAPAPVADCGCGDPQAATVVQQPQQTMQPGPPGPVGPVHDPVMAKEGKTYYVFATGLGIQVRSSTDRVTWSQPTRVFDPVPSWTATTVPGSREFYWAPDVSFFNHRWHLYYAVSTFGRNRSAIGLATNESLDPKSPKYRWVDQGPVFQSYPTDSYNAIDPSIALDQHGKPWMTFGSFWSGIKILEIDPESGRPAKPNEPPIAIAERSRANGQPGAIEAPSILRHGRFFYLFVSFDFCCRGVRSTYNIRVGRSRNISGPYVDQAGKPMLEDGGTLVLAGATRWKGPGGSSVLRDGRTDLLVFHSYDSQQNGMPKLQIEPISWDRDNWPQVAPLP